MVDERIARLGVQLSEVLAASESAPAIVPVVGESTEIVRDDGVHCGHMWYGPTVRRLKSGPVWRWEPMFWLTIVC